LDAPDVKPNLYHLLACPSSFLGLLRLATTQLRLRITNGRWWRTCYIAEFRGSQSEWRGLGGTQHASGVSER